MLKCKHCGDPIERTTNRGPVPKYCGAACRQAAHRERVGSYPTLRRWLDDQIDSACEEIAALVEAATSETIARGHHDVSIATGKIQAYKATLAFLDEREGVK